MLRKKITVKENERVITLKKGEFSQILTPGYHSFFNTNNNITFEAHTINVPRIQSNIIEMITTKYSQALSNHIISVKPQENQIGIVYINSRIYDLVKPGIQANYWKDSGEIKVEYVNISEDFFVEESKHALLKEYLNVNSTVCEMIDVPEEYVGLIYVNNSFYKLLDPGKYFIWNVGRSIVTKLVNLKLTELELTGQEVLTKDKVTIRVNVTTYYQITDPKKVVSELNDYVNYIHKQLQFALRKEVEALTLDEVLDSKSTLDKNIKGIVDENLKNYGIDVQSTNIKDIILPGEMREILNQVIQAEKLAQSNLIKRREEVAATRSLLNTAKLMDDHPMLLRLKEIEAVENILQKVDNLSLYSGAENLLNNIFLKSKEK